jgi:hypothetical protein
MSDWGSGHVFLHSLIPGIHFTGPVTWVPMWPGNRRTLVPSGDKQSWEPNSFSEAWHLQLLFLRPGGKTDSAFLSPDFQAAQGFLLLMMTSGGQGLPATSLAWLHSCTGAWGPINTVCMGAVGRWPSTPSGNGRDPSPQLHGSRLVSSQDEVYGHAASQRFLNCSKVHLFFFFF